ncbi:MAG: hypothetical protein WDZ94_02630 [Patescibacteria group bacterium]
MNIYPALLSDSLAQLQEQLDRIQPVDALETVQIDVIDGYFADNMTVTPSDLPELNFGRLRCDIHLMTIDPLDYVHELVPRHDELPIRAVIAQVEKMHHQDHFLEEVQKQGWEPGLSLDIFTPIAEGIEEDSWQFLKVVQLMSIEAGFQGQQFNDLVLEKVTELQQIAADRKLDFEIMLDGGINQDTITKVSQAGVKSVVVGSALWKSESISETIQTLGST